MEEILIDDASDSCVIETPVAGLANNAVSTAGGSTTDSPRVMSMLYIQPSVNQSNNNTSSANQQSSIVQAKPISFAQLPAIAHQFIEPITFHTTSLLQQTANASSIQGQKHILVQRSHAAGAQIMSLGTSAESSSISQNKVIKSGIFFGTDIKPKSKESTSIPPALLDSLQLAKPKSQLIIKPTISHVTLGQSNNNSNGQQKQPTKHMTNLLLPLTVQSGSSASKKQNYKILNPSLKYKLNNGIDSKSSITVLKESKTSNSVPNPPPLQPITKMSLLSSSKSGNSTDSIKITESSDSAVITPIPNNEDSDKQKKSVTSMLRASGEKRSKKQSFSSLLETNSVDDSGYTLDSLSSEYDKEKKIDKESDDDITLIKVVHSEEKKPKQFIISDEVNVEVIKGSSSKEIEVIETIKGKKSNEDSKDQSSHQNDSNFDAARVLEWKDGVGSLPGSTVKFCMNEFGLLEVVDEDDNKNDKDNNVGDKENVCLTQNSSKSSTPTIINEKKEEKKTREPSADTFYCCEACGCHGLASEFESPNSCSPSCTHYIKVMQQKNKEMKKKKRKKLLEQQAKMKEKSKDSKSNDSDEKSKDSEDKFEKTKSESIKSASDEDTKDTNMDVDEESQGESESKQYPWLTGKNGFSWSKYLECTKAKAAPVKLFKDAFPYGKNNFKAGMKLEGIDPNHPSQYCVLTVAEVVGYRVRLHFDGYAETFDFWVNADSMDIFPCGWAEKNGHKLQPPKGYVPNNFSWNAYLKICKATAAPKTLFLNKNSMLPTGFRVGMKLEAVDRKHSSLVCVASVADVMDSRILVHFDSWDDIYDYWADVSSPYIHPIGWCHHNGRELTPPNYYKDPKSFSWDIYLKGTSSVAAPSRAFKQRPPCGFKRGMKLEAVDKRLPQLIRVATVEDVKDHMLKIRFDGWPENHAFWVDDDSTDIHPMGWCSKTGHPLEAPITQDNLTDRPECGTFGCRGVGHVKGPKFATHNSASGCPYSPQNLNKIKSIVDRLNLKSEASEFDEELNLEKPKIEKSEKIKMERSERRISSYDEKPIKIENIKQEDDDSDKNDKLNSSETYNSKWQNSDGQSDEEEVVRRGRKRKRKDKEDTSFLSMFNSNNDTSASRGSYASNMPDKQLRLELYHSVYNPGYNPLPDAPHIWAKHSSALNRVVSKQSTNPRRWSNEEVIKFIQSIPNCKEIGSIFRKHSVDGEAFLMLTQEDLVTLLGLRLGPAIKLYNSIVLLRKKAS